MVVGVKRLLAAAYIGVLIAYLGGFMVMPELFLRYTHQGVSSYGNYYPAFIPYLIGLTISLTCLFFAGYFLPNSPRRLGVLKTMLPAMAICIVGILLTPDELSTFFFYTHLLIAVTLFTTAAVTGLWAFLQPGRQLIDWVLLFIMVVGVCLALLSATFVAVMGVLPWGQLLAINGAFLLIIRGAWRWLPEGKKRKVSARSRPSVRHSHANANPAKK